MGANNPRKLSKSERKAYGFGHMKGSENITQFGGYSSWIRLLYFEFSVCSSALESCYDDNKMLYNWNTMLLMAMKRAWKDQVMVKVMFIANKNLAQRRTLSSILSITWSRESNDGKIVFRAFIMKSNLIRNLGNGTETQKITRTFRGCPFGNASCESTSRRKNVDKRTKLVRYLLDFRLFSNGFFHLLLVSCAKFALFFRRSWSSFLFFRSFRMDKLLKSQAFSA